MNTTPAERYHWLHLLQNGKPLGRSERQTVLDLLEDFAELETGKHAEKMRKWVESWGSASESVQKLEERNQELRDALAQIRDDTDEPPATRIFAREILKADDDSQEPTSDPPDEDE